MINRSDIIRLTANGLNIYSIILGYYCKEDRILFSNSGMKCTPARNPFNGDKETLLISQKEVNGMFFYEDSELPGFRGDPFDFAALHYKLQGDELLERINRDLNLHDGKGEGFYSGFAGKKPILINEMAFPHFSFFRKPITNVRPTCSISIEQAYKVIKGNRYKDRTRELRAITDPAEAARFKQSNLDYVTPCGIFLKRQNSALEIPSGLLVLDFDHVDDPKALKETLVSDNFFKTTLSFISPLGHGLKWIIPADPALYSHQEWFRFLYFYVRKQYGLEIDQSGKDIARACFLCHDPEVYIHPDYLIN